MNHIMLQCAFSRSFWLQICTALGKPEWTPTQDGMLPSWLVNIGGDGMPARDSRTIIILSLWELWKHRNGIVFDGDSPSLNRLFGRILSEGRAWETAGLIRSDLEPFFRWIHRWVGGEV